MGTAHTDAPWVNVGDWNIVNGSNDCTIATVLGPESTAGVKNDDERKANARLIAAAPRLLKMLKEANAAFYGAGTSKALRAALAGSKELIHEAEGRK